MAGEISKRYVERNASDRPRQRSSLSDNVEMKGRASMRMLGSKFAGLVIAIALGVPRAADAQTVRWKEYLHPEKSTLKEFYQLYLAGVRDGLIAYSVVTHENLFCLPGKLVLTNEQLDDIMKRWAEKQTVSLDSRPIGLIALAALRGEFPCQ